MLTLGDILDAAMSDAPNADERLKQVCEWQLSREMTAVKGLFGLAAILFAAFLPAFFGEHGPGFWVKGGFALGGAALTAIAGVAFYLRLRDTVKAYLVAVRYYDRFRHLAPLLHGRV